MRLVRSLFAVTVALAALTETACKRSRPAPPEPAPPGPAPSAEVPPPPLPIPSAEAFVIASGARWGDGGEVVFLVARDETTMMDLLGWDFEHHSLRLVASLERSAVELRNFEEAEHGQRRALVDIACALAGVTVATPTPNDARASDANVASVRLADGRIVRREGHGHIGGFNALLPSAIARPDGLFVALGTESEITVVRKSDGTLFTFRGRQNRELSNTVRASAVLGGGPTGLRWRGGTLVWGPIAAANGKITSPPWPDAQLSIYANSPSAGILLFDVASGDALGKGGRAPKTGTRLLVPDAEKPRFVDLPATPITRLRFSDRPPATTTERQLAIDAEASRVAWFTRAVGKSWSMRRVLLSGGEGAVSDVDFEAGEPRLVSSSANEPAFAGPRAPLPRPGKDSVFATVPPERGELVEVDFTARSVKRFGAVGDAVAVSPSGSHLLLTRNDAFGLPRLFDVESREVIALQPCFGKEPQPPAAFSLDGRYVFVRLTKSAPREQWKVGRYRVREGDCDDTFEMHHPTDAWRATGALAAMTAKTPMTAMTATPHAVIVLDERYELGLYEPESGKYLASLAFGETWLAARFADGTIEVWGNEADAETALWCHVPASEPARFGSCPPSVRTRGRLGPLLAP